MQDMHGKKIVEKQSNSSNRSQRELKNKHQQKQQQNYEKTKQENIIFNYEKIQKSTYLLEIPSITLYEQIRQYKKTGNVITVDVQL